MQRCGNANGYCYPRAVPVAWLLILILAGSALTPTIINYPGLGAGTYDGS